MGSQQTMGYSEILEFRNSHAAGMYLGTTTGPGENEVVRNVIARNCAARRDHARYTNR